jgi:hypothetical protein
MNKYLNLDEFKIVISAETPSGKIIEIDPINQTKIDKENIKEDLEFLPSQYLFIAIVYLHNKEKRDTLELELDRIKTDSSKLVREKWDEIEQGKCTEKKVEEIVGSDQEIRNKELQLIKLTTVTNQLYYLCKAIDKKFYSMKSMSYFTSQTEVENTDGVEIDIHKFEKLRKQI